MERVLCSEMDAKMNAIKITVLRYRNCDTSEDSSSSDDEWKVLLYKREKRKHRPRIQNYIDHVVVHYMGHEFKSHFRLVNKHTLYFIIHYVIKNIICTCKYVWIIRNKVTYNKYIIKYIFILHNFISNYPSILLILTFLFVYRMSKASF